jgi:peptide/nickel transport system substrate-binding protein
MRRCRIVVLVLLAACTRTGSFPVEPHVLRIADNVDPSSLNPLLAHDQDTIGWDLLVTQTLVGLDVRNRLVPILVTRVPSLANGDISSDGKTIVYHLRRGVHFADGTPLTSADVAFTFRAILDPRNPVESEDAYRRIASLQTPDAHTVVIHLKRRWNAAVAEIFAQADFAFGILPAHAFSSTDVTKGEWNQHPFGTGPFRVAEWERGNRIVLDRNPYYRPRPKLRRIVFPIIPSIESSLLAVRSHEADVSELTPQQLPYARAARGTHLLVTPTNGEYMLMLQTTTWPTSDAHVRRAIAAAIDKRVIARAGFGVLAPADSFLPPVFGWHDPAPQTAAADPAAVTRELSGDGWRRIDGWWTKNGRRLSVTIDFTPQRVGSWMETIELEQLRRAGIDAHLKPYTLVQFNAPGGPLRTGRFTAASTQWIGAADPEQSVIFACSQRGANGNNDMGYCNPRFDALFEDQATTTDSARRRRDFVQMQRIVRKDVPVVPIAFQSIADLVGNRVFGFQRNMLWYPVSPQSWDVR